MKKAFTLAEILITLGVIGIIAALTLPAIITNYEKKVTVEKLKKTYSVLSQALALSYVENGAELSTADDWNNIIISEYATGDTNRSIKYMSKYWLPYIKGYKLCKTYEECGYKSNTPFKDLRGISTTLISVVKPSGNSGASYVPFILPDGVLVSIQLMGMGCFGCMDIYIDINASKPPNKLGRDLFVLRRTGGEDNRIIGLPDYSNTVNAKYYCNSSYLYDTGGFWCYARIMSEGWQITKDYPWK